MTSSARGRVRVERSGKRVRALLGGETVADAEPLLVWEKPFYPTYYFPEGDVRTDLLVETGGIDHSPSRGDATRHSVKVGDRLAEGAAAWYAESPIDELVGTIRLDWDAMDAWFEEDMQVHVHARDPYTRIDVLDSSRHVTVAVDGMTVADTTNARVLFETGLPRRWYIPKTDVRMDLLTPTDHVTHCPYKGDASYYDLTVDGTTHDNLVWWYKYPARESEPIAGLVCFYDEVVDVTVDGVPQERPKTHFR